jgi:hypothetical protein
LSTQAKTRRPDDARQRRTQKRLTSRDPRADDVRANASAVCVEYESAGAQV